MVGGDDVGVGRHFLDLALAGIGHAGQKVHQTPGHILVGGFQIQHHGPLVLQLVGDLRGVFKAVGLYQHHLQLGGGVDIHHLVPAVLRLVAAIFKRALPRLFKILVFLILVVVGMGQLFQLVKNAHARTSCNQVG